MAAPTISDDLSANFVSPGTGGSSVGNLTIGAGTKMVVAVLGSSSSDPVDEGSGGMSVGGVAMTQAFEGANGAVWYLDDMTGLSGAEACVVYFNSGGYRAAVTFYALDHADPLELRDTTFGSGYADNAPTLYTLPNMSGSTADAWSAGFAHNDGFFTGNIVLGGDLVEDHDHNIASIRIKTYHDTTTPLGGHSYANGTGGTMFMGMAMFGPVAGPGDIAFAPDPFGVEVGFQAGITFGPGADVGLFPQRFGVEVGWRSGIVFGATGPRQVMLVGADIETPEMTEGGEDGWVLTFHPTAKPTWEPGSGPGSLALDDLSDVDAPTPTDGYVLTFDSASGDWIDAPPAGGGSIEVKELDGAPDVDPVSVIRVPNGSLVDDGGGQVTLTWVTSLDWAEDGDITTAAFGDAPAANAGTEVAPAGHRHGMPANPVGTAAVMAVLDFGESGDISATAPGDTAAAGATGEVADAGHRHPRLGDVFAVVVTLDNGGVVLTTGHKVDLYCPFAFTIQEWTILGEPTGAIVIDIWSDTYANYPPTNADSITASAKPTVTATNPKGQSSTLTGWTSSGAIAAGNCLRFNVDSVTSMTRATLVLKCVRT